MCSSNIHITPQQRLVWSQLLVNFILAGATIFIIMSLVHAFPVPELLWVDLVVVAAGLGVGIGSCFELIFLTLSKKNADKLFTFQNFWLILSGVIHVKTQFDS